MTVAAAVEAAAAVVAVRLETLFHFSEEIREQQLRLAEDCREVTPAMRKANILLRELFTFHGSERAEAAGQGERRADGPAKLFFFFKLFSGNPKGMVGPRRHIRAATLIVSSIVKDKKRQSTLIVQ